MQGAEIRQRCPQALVALVAPVPPGQRHHALAYIGRETARSGVAGTPATITSGATSPVTTAPAAITAPAPMVGIARLALDRGGDNAGAVVPRHMGFIGPEIRKQNRCVFPPRPRRQPGNVKSHEGITEVKKDQGRSRECRHASGSEVVLDRVDQGCVDHLRLPWSGACGSGQTVDRSRQWSGTAKGKSPQPDHSGPGPIALQPSDHSQCHLAPQSQGWPKHAH